MKNYNYFFYFFDKIFNFLGISIVFISVYITRQKSYLIKTIRLWIKETLNKDTAVTAPTGIAAFNIDGLTIHRLFQLPVEHGRTPLYRQLSDQVLKLLRDQLKNVELIIIDEISMISNVTLMYIHLRLTEIFNTTDVENGWFGKKHIILFGDLLQLPPVHESPPFVKLPSSKIEKYIGAMGSIDLWSSLFSYDELNVNMRQKGDVSYRNLLSRIRLGIAIDSDTAILESRKLVFKASTIEGRISELCDVMNKLPSDTVCLLPTCSQCDALNTAMLDRIPSPEIQLTARDSIECATFLKRKVAKALCTDEESSSRTAGLAKIITVKIGAQIMIRRNIDVTLGLVNGTIAKIVSVTRDSQSGDIETITILIQCGSKYTLERASVKFEIMDRAFVVRKQFPICLSYGMTIHKSQGLSLKNAVIEAGNSIFISGQIYVALSRVTALDGLHLINYDPASVKSNVDAILEYNRLRKIYRPDLLAFEIFNGIIKKNIDTKWVISRKVADLQETSQYVFSGNSTFNVKGLPNNDKTLCYANASIQCLIHCSIIRDAILSQCIMPNVVQSFVTAYMSENQNPDVLEICKFVGDSVFSGNQHDASLFLTSLCDKLETISMHVQHQINLVIACSICKAKTSKTYMNNILPLTVSSLQKEITLQDIIDNTIGKWKGSDGRCSGCNSVSLFSKIELNSLSKMFLVKLSIFEKQGEIVIKKKISIKAVPRTKIKINGNEFKVMSAILHHGHDITSGHYSSILRHEDDSWVSVDDLKVRKRQWPRNGKDVYILFLASSDGKHPKPRRIRKP